MLIHIIQENDQRRQLEEKRKKREEAKKAAEEAKRKKLAAKGEAPTAEPEEPNEETCVIDNLLKEIRAGTTLRRTGQNSVHRRGRRTSQLKKDDLQRLNQIVEKAAVSPRKSLTPVPSDESQFKFPVVDEENKNEREVNKANGVETPNDSAKASNDDAKASREGMTNESLNIGKKAGNIDTTLNGQGINGETDATPLPNGENHAIDTTLNGQGINGETDATPLPNGKNLAVLKPESKTDQDRDLSVTQSQRLTSPAVGDTAANSQSLPTSPAKEQLPDEGLPNLKTATRGPNRETKSLQKEGTGSLKKVETGSLKKESTGSSEKEGTGSKGAGSLEKEETGSDGTRTSSETSLNLTVSCTYMYSNNKAQYRILNPNSLSLSLYCNMSYLLHHSSVLYI